MQDTLPQTNHACPELPCQSLTIVCFDLDGTLVDEAGKIHPLDICILKDPPGNVVFIPASGRSLASVKTVFASNGLFAGELFPYPLILQNGSLILVAGEKPIGYFPFEPTLQKALISIAMMHKEVTYLFMGKNHIDKMWENDFGTSLIKKYDFNVRSLDIQMAQPPYSKVMCLSDHYELLLQLQDACSKLVADLAFSMRTILEVTPKGVNKGSGLTCLIEALGLKGIPVLAAGNDQNDFPMLQQADVVFAPDGSNAVKFCHPENIINPMKNGILTNMLQIQLSKEEL